MRNTLLLRADPTDAGSWHWLRLDQDGKPQGSIHAGSLGDAASEASGLRVVMLVPGIDCLLTSVSIPGSNRKKLLRAVPYALEEQLSDEVENLHFAVGTSQVDGAWPVVVIGNHKMETLLQAVSEAGLDVQLMIPEVLAVPYTENEISVLVGEDMALVRNGVTSGLAVDCDNLGMLLGAVQQDQQDEEAPPVVHLLVQEGSPLPDTSGIEGARRIEQYAGDPLTVFARGLDSKSINLLQGAYGRSGEWGRLLRPWRATAALLLAGVLVSNVVMGVDYFRLSKESEQLTSQIEAVFRKALPDTQRVVDPRVQMQQQLDRLENSQGRGNRFLTLLAQSAEVLKGKQGVEVSGATFRAGRLDIDLKVSNLQLLDELKQALSESGGLSVEIQSATTGKDQRVQSRLRIQGVGS
jgi:general secretion pathway protein L